MTGVTLNATDAAELAEMLQFLADWLNHDPGRLRASLEDFVGHPAYNTRQMREDLDRSISCSAAATGNLSSAHRSNGMHAGAAFPVSRGYAGPSRRQRRSSSRCALRALHADPAPAPALTGSHPGKPTGGALQLTPLRHRHFRRLSESRAMPTQ
jgi:hypothetical protein